MIYSYFNPTIIEAAIAHSPDYYVPLLIAARDSGLGILSIPQRNWPLEMPVSSRPYVPIIADDTDRALGPSGFDATTMARLFGWADVVFVVACAPTPSIYSAAALSATALKRKTAIIETRRTHQREWISSVLSANRDVQIVVGTAREGGK